MNSTSTNAEATAQSKVNVGNGERLFSIVSGLWFIRKGLSQGGISGVSSLVIGSGMVCRGVLGECKFYTALGIDHSKS